VIVVISYPEDPHATRVIGLLEQAGHQVVLFDLSDLPDRATMTIDYSEPTRPRAEYHRGGTRLDLTSAGSVWWRRPQMAEPRSITDPDTYFFATNEWGEAVNGLWQVLDAAWMNPPAYDEVAGRKALQLRLAAQVGLRVPRTLITSDPDRARRFVEAQGVGNTVFKTFSCTHAIWRETRLVRAEELDALDSVRLAPVIFQEYVPAEADLRITVVGDHIYPAAIHSAQTGYPVDFRMSLGEAQTEPTTLPDDVTRQLRAFMDRLGLVYGAIDMRRTPEGDHVFLEVNTGGEFLFIEERTGQPIARSLADWLAARAATPAAA
jgi:glutathione synthase/RimK-type ligase-like ATP-grasp enzyme